MARNRIQFQKGLSEVQFADLYEMNVGLVLNERRSFEIILPGVGRIVCEATTKLVSSYATEAERKAMAKLHVKGLSEALISA